MYSAGYHIPRPATANSRLGSRPLSDIKEAMEPSLDSHRAGNPELDGIQQRGSRRFRRATEPNFSYGGSGADAEFFSYPQQSPYKKIHRRKSSRSHLSRKTLRPVLDLSPPALPGMTIPNRGDSRSPVRSIARRKAPISSDSVRKVPSRTFVRPVEPYGLLEFPDIRHPLVKLDIRVPSPLFMGGGTVEGRIDVTVSRGASKGKQDVADVSLGRIGVDLIGVEEVSSTQKSIFLMLATELIDATHPPPATMLAPAGERSHSVAFWPLMASTSLLPFRLNLPLNVGPGPFCSGRARIRYILCVTFVMIVGGKQASVRRSQEISLVSAYDPERALVSLPSPLIVSDEHVRRRGGGTETIKVTAGIHRQVWVSGTTIYVDVHIANNSYKKARRLTLELVRWIGGYKHAAALTKESTASHLRVPDWKEIKTVSKTVIKGSKDGAWKGVLPHSSDMLTCEVQVPRDNLSIRMGRYFEVRFFVAIQLDSAFSKLVQVQLPVTIIHMNSLDVVPNSLGQVSCAIEGRRGRRSPSRSRRRSESVQGRAFSAPRKQSVTRLRNETVTPGDIDGLAHELDNSPRKTRKTSSYEDHLRVQERNRLAAEDVPDLRHALSLDLTAPRIQATTSGLEFADMGWQEDEYELLNAEEDLPSREQVSGTQQSEMSTARKISSSSHQDDRKNVAAEEVQIISQGQTRRSSKRSGSMSGSRSGSRASSNR